MQLYPKLELPFDIGLPDFGRVQTIVVEQMIGQGLFGHVWRIRDLSTDRLLALEQVKIDPDQPDRESEFAMQVSQAIENQPDSPFLPNTYGILKLDTHEFGILHQYYKGQSLKNWIEDHLNSPWTEKRHVFAQILAATQVYLSKADRFDPIALEQIEVLEGPIIRVNGYSKIHYKRYEDEKPKFKDRISHEAPEQYFEMVASQKQEKMAVFSLSVLLYSLIKGKPYWEGLSKVRAPFKEMLQQDDLSGSNILDTFHPTFTHTAEEAIIGLRFGTVFDPAKRNLDLDELIYHFGKIDLPSLEPQEPQANPVEETPPIQEEPEPESPEREEVPTSPPPNKEKEEPAVDLPAEAEAKQKTSTNNWIIIAIGLVLMSGIAFAGWKMKTAFGSTASNQLEEKAKWRMAENRATEFHLKQYLSDYPDGKYKAEAEKRLAQLPLPNFELSWLTAKRFTGKIDRFDDLQVFTIRMKTLEDRTDRIRFTSSVNIGAVRKNIEGWIYKADLKIRFEDTAEDVQKFGIADGRLYFDGEEIFFESIDLEQYWILE
ncbi:MAG: protein kinase [Bacteroidota bacterium]